MSIVEFKEVSRVYKNGDHEQWALNHINLSLEEGKFIVILGPSGAGRKSLYTFEPFGRTGQSNRGHDCGGRSGYFHLKQQ